MTSGDQESRLLRDFVTWREELESIEDLSTFRTVERNLFVSEGRGEPVEVAEISASAFRVARVQPQLGRFLVAPDELASSPPVIVISHAVWQTRFDGDPGILGRTVRLGDVRTSVVGVMPKEFAFPISHEAWTPFRYNALNYARLEGPEIRVLGRLARGATLDKAQTELDYLGRRAAADFAEPHEHLRPRVMPYPQSIGALSESELAALPWLNLFVVMLVVLVCGNVGNATVTATCAMMIAWAKSPFRCVYVRPVRAQIGFSRDRSAGAMSTNDVNGHSKRSSSKRTARRFKKSSKTGSKRCVRAPERSATQVLGRYPGDQRSARSAGTRARMTPPSFAH